MLGNRVNLKEVDDTINRGRYVVLIALPIVIASAVFVPIHWPSFLGGIGLGVVAFVGAIAAWHWYHPWFSWLVAAVPVAAGFGALLGQYGITGEASILNLFLQSLYSAMVVFFGLLWLLRGRVMRWIVQRSNA